VAHYKGRIVEILLEGYQNAAAILECPKRAAPKAGEYLQAHQTDDPMEVVPASLFAAGDVSLGADGHEFVTLPVTGSLPETWQPGTQLALHGPLGKGFTLPKRSRRVALVALEDNPAKLMPLISEAIKQSAEIALFCDADQLNLPLVVEQQSLKDLPSAIRWADYLAANISVDSIDLIEALPRTPAALVSEILIHTPMPCGGMAKCGVCTVHTRKGPRLACEDGPVFGLRDF
jgi:dihydroorotate dehydrogenase electron transfer subunit